MASSSARTYADHVVDLLVGVGYTHCFLVPGGAIMHLVNATRSRMTCIPVVHEVAAVIAAEYFNALSDGQRAFALVTAGPGITNALTGVAGAYLESRDVLVISGQVKSTDLSRGDVRQRGIQEIEGVAIAAPVAVTALRIEKPESDAVLIDALTSGLSDRKGPVYLEFCLDAQGAPFGESPVPPIDVVEVSQRFRDAAPAAVTKIEQALGKSCRPVILVGGGASYRAARDASAGLARLGVPVMTTWNGFDRIADDHPCFAGRPNTWGQRWANIVLAQADCIVALGTRLGIQQTGFNWQEWGPAVGSGTVVQVEVDEGELAKGHPRVDVPLLADANSVLAGISQLPPRQLDDWWAFIREVRDHVPIVDPENVTAEGNLSPYELMRQLSEELLPTDVLIPASSGSGQFVPMETFEMKTGQRVATNKGLASMGYGLPAAMGAAATGASRVVLIEGDGSFSQSIQELGTVALRSWPIKIFLLDNDGYASIRTTQRNYFAGAYVGCDSATGLGFPDWHVLARAFGIPSVQVGSQGIYGDGVRELLAAPGPGVFVVTVDPEQTYYPKVTSRVTEDGSMASNPVHLMSPPLPEEVAKRVFRFRQNEPS